MIDGFKIATKHRSTADWLSDSLLSFRSIIDEKTGELQGTGTYAEHQGLFFSVYPYKNNHSSETCYIRGSLARFYNGGLDNAFDFNIHQVSKALARLQTMFKLDLNNVSLHGLEIGFNLLLPIKVKEFFQRLKHIRGSGLGALYNGRRVVGRKVDFQQYTLKLYDKGKQQNTDEEHLIRFEIVVKKMAFLKGFGVCNVVDIQNPIKVRNIALLLVDWLKDSIFHEKEIQYKEMTNHEQKKWLSFGDATKWERFNRKQKNYAKSYFNRLVKDYCKNPIKDIIVEKMTEKVHLLTADNLGQFNQDSQNMTANKLGQFNHLNKGLKCSNKPQHTKKEKHNKNTLRKRAKCKVCEKDIRAKKKGAVYCSKKCNNKYNGMERTKRNRKRINREKLGMMRLETLIPKQKLWLLVTYKEKGVEYSDYLHQSEIQTTNDWIRKVIKIRADNYRKNSKPIELHGFRARKIINQINKLNKKLL